MGRVFGFELFTIAKVGAVITSFLGILLVSLGDTSRSASTNVVLLLRSLASHPSAVSVPEDHPSISNPLLGDSLALLSALFYALYVTLLKVRIRTESRIDMQLFFGFVGLFNILSLWPIGIILHVTGAEKFELPTGRDAWVAVGINVSFYLFISMFVGSHTNLNVGYIDVHHLVKRLYLPPCHAQDYTSPRHARSLFDYSTSNGRRLLPLGYQSCRPEGPWGFVGPCEFRGYRVRRVS